MVHAVSAAFERNEHMSPPAAGLAVLLHVLVAAFLIWAPTHHPDADEEPIEVTMEAPPPPPAPEPKPEAEKPKPPPPAAAAKPAPALDRLGLPPAGPVGPKSTAPPMERGLPTYEPPAVKAEQPAPKEEQAAQPPPPPQQAMAQPAEPPPPPPPPPAPTLEKELPPVEAPPAPLTSRDIPRLAPPVPERKPEPAPPQPQPQPQQRAQPPRPAAPPSPQLQPSPLSRLPRNAPSQRQSEPPRSTFVNPADTYAQNTVLEAYLQRVVYQVSRYSFDGAGLVPTDSVVARFTIARNGSLLAVSIIRSSGKPSLDRDAVTAFQRTAPFPPLPADVPGESQTFSLTFFPGRRP